MIKVEGFKAFHGVMKITPKTKMIPVAHIEADWLYIPDKKVWIANGVEYSEGICTVVRDDAEKQIPKKLLPDNRCYGIGKCPNCGAVFTSKSTKYCGNCGQALDWGDKR